MFVVGFAGWRLMSPFAAVIIGAAVVVLILVAVSRSRRSNDGVDSFRRQIDALSPEARRPVIDQMYSSTDRTEPRADPRIDLRPTDATSDAVPDEAADTDSPDTDPPDTDSSDTGDQDGVNGT